MNQDRIATDLSQAQWEYLKSRLSAVRKPLSGPLPIVLDVYMTTSAAKNAGLAGISNGKGDMHKINPGYQEIILNPWQEGSLLFGVLAVLVCRGAEFYLNGMKKNHLVKGFSPFFFFQFKDSVIHIDFDDLRMLGIVNVQQA